MLLIGGIALLAVGIGLLGYGGIRQLERLGMAGGFQRSPVTPTEVKYDVMDDIRERQKKEEEEWASRIPPIE